MGLKRRWSFHVCTPWNECSMDGFRLNISTPWAWIGIALNPDARFANRLDRPAQWISVHRAQ